MNYKSYISCLYYAGATECRASRGWLEKFMKRNCFSLRRQTTVSQRLPKDFVPKVTMFVMPIRRLRHTNNYPLGSIVNMDETLLWFDMPGASTITHSGERSVPVQTTVWDPYKCHLTDGVRTIIPGGLTGHIQLADVCWNKPLREAYKELYSKWTATGDKSYTQAGNLSRDSDQVISSAVEFL